MTLILLWIGVNAAFVALRARATRKRKTPSHPFAEQPQ